jgi:hypothetical protein
MFNAKYGITNVLVDWSDELMVLVHRMIELLDIDQLRLILLGDGPQRPRAYARLSRSSCLERPG